MRYKWKKIQKVVFFDRYEREDVIEYREIFFDEIKFLLPYFVKFSDDRSILPKTYLKDYIVGGLNWRPIIIITHVKSIFFANNN